MEETEVNLKVIAYFLFFLVKCACMYICSAIVEYYFVLNTIYCIQCIKRDSLMYMYNYRYIYMEILDCV